MTQIRTYYKRWLLIATDHQVTGKRGNDEFELRKQRNIKEAVEAGKRKVDRFSEEKNE
jgi:hypothetical protein